LHEQICVVAGHICLDIILNITGKKSDKSNSIFLPGRLNEVAPAILSTGGIVSNVGIALYKLGINTKLIGKVGNDFFGKAITQLLSSLDETLANRIITGREINTSYTLIINQTEIDRILFHHPGANDTFSVNDINYDEFENVKIFHFGYPPLMKSMYEDGGEQLNEIFRLVKERGVTTSLDMALPDSSIEFTT